MSKHGSLVFQVKSTLAKMEAYGQSKHADKISGRGHGDRIYSHSTMRNYLRESLKFVNFVREHYPETRTLEQARSHVDDYLTHIIDNEWKPASIALAAASLGKVYREPVTNFRDRPAVTRASITRSRGLDNTAGRINREVREKLEAVTRTFILRRCDLRNLRPEWMHQDSNGTYFLEIPAGISKGGRPRSIVAYAPNTAEGRERLERAVKIIENTLPGNKVFPHIHSHYYPHSDRAAGCRERYEAYVREVLAQNNGEIPRFDRYTMRNSYDADGESDGLGGTVLSRSALKRCGAELGHGENRESLVAGHYLYNRGGK